MISGGKGYPAFPDYDFRPLADIRPFDPALFGDAAIDPDTANLNAQMIELLTGQPEWWIVGAQEARAARRRGEARSRLPCSRDGREPALGSVIFALGSSEAPIAICIKLFLVMRVPSCR